MTAEDARTKLKSLASPAAALAATRFFKTGPGQGMFVNMPVGVPHSFKNESDKPAKMLISIAPAGLEQMFFECGVPVEQGAKNTPPPTKAEIEKMLKIAPRYRIEITVPGH